MNVKSKKLITYYGVILMMLCTVFIVLFKNNAFADQLLKETYTTYYEKVWEGDDEVVLRYASSSSPGGASDPMAISSSGHIASIQDVVDALNEGREPFITGEEALKAVRVVSACLKSGGSPVRL